MTEKADKYEIVTNKIVELLEQGVKAWERPWHRNGEGIYKNLVNGNSYSGINPIICMVDCIRNEHELPFFATFKQAADLGWKVRKGAKSTWLRWGGSYTVEDDEGNKQFKGASKWLGVFNAEMIDDSASEYKISDAIDKLEVKEQSQVNPDERILMIEKFIADKNAKFLHEAGDRAYYAPEGDTIQMPKFESFKSAQAYYAVKLHELTHWTGHKSRLNREMQGNFGSQKYAYEELIAELGSAFVCSKIGISSQIENHASYIDGWIQILKSDKKIFFKAASDARKAADWLCGIRNAVE